MSNDKIQEQAGSIARQAAENGIAHQAGKFWNEKEDQAFKNIENGKDNWIWGATKASACKLMGLFVSASGLEQLELSGAKFEADKDLGAPTRTIIKDGASLAGNLLMAGATFTPALGVAKGIKFAKGVEESVALGKQALAREAERTAGRTAEIVAAKQLGKAAAQDGIVLTGEEAARISAQDAVKIAQAQSGKMKALAGMTPAHDFAAAKVGQKLSRIAAEIPASGKLSFQQTEKTFHQLQTVAKEYGINIRAVKGAPECTGDIAQEIRVTRGKTGGAHELVHVFQYLQTRMTALESKAIRLGKSVKQLNQAEIKAAYSEMVHPFENQTIPFMESRAVESVGMMRITSRSCAVYRRGILNSIRAQAKGLKNAALPELPRGVVARGYGQLPGVVGYTQGEIGAKVLPPVVGLYNTQRSPKR